MWSNGKRTADRPRTILQLEVLETRNLLSSFITPPSPTTTLSPVQQLQVDATTLVFNAKVGASAETLKENLKTVSDDFKDVNLPSLSSAEVGALLIAGGEVAGTVASLGTRAFTDPSIAKLALDMTSQATQIIGGALITELAGVSGLVQTQQAQVNSAIDVQPGASPPQKSQEKGSFDQLYQFLKNAVNQLVTNVVDATGTEAEAAEFTALQPSAPPPAAPSPPADQDPDNDGDVDMY